MRRLKSTRNSLVLALLATFLLTIDTISANKEPDEDLTTTSTTATITVTDSSLVFDEENDTRLDAFNSDNVKTKKKEHLFCSGSIKRGIVWPDAKAGTKSSAPCPDGSNGTQSWECSSEGRWVTENPNTALCKSYWIDYWVKYLEFILEYHKEIKVYTTFPMVEGDWPSVLCNLEHVQTVAEKSQVYEHQKRLNLVVFDVLEQIFRDTGIWESWDVVKRKEYAPRFLAVMAKSMASAKEAHSTRDIGETTASAEDIQSLIMTIIMVLLLLPCGLLIAYMVDAVFSQLRKINLPSLAIIKQFWKRVQRRLQRKQPQLASDWISQLVIQDKKTGISDTSSPQSEQPIRDYDERRDNDEELPDRGTCEIPVLDRRSRIAELEKELVELRMQAMFGINL